MKWDYPQSVQADEKQGGLLPTSQKLQAGSNPVFVVAIKLIHCNIILILMNNDIPHDFPASIVIFAFQNLGRGVHVAFRCSPPFSRKFTAQILDEAICFSKQSLNSFFFSPVSSFNREQTLEA